MGVVTFAFPLCIEGDTSICLIGQVYGFCSVRIACAGAVSLCVPADEVIAGPSKAVGDQGLCLIKGKCLCFHKTTRVAVAVKGHTIGVRRPASVEGVICPGLHLGCACHLRASTWRCVPANEGIALAAPRWQCAIISTIGHGLTCWADLVGRCTAASFVGIKGHCVFTGCPLSVEGNAAVRRSGQISYRVLVHIGCAGAVGCCVPSVEGMADFGKALGDQAFAFSIPEGLIRHRSTITAITIKGYGITVACIIQLKHQRTVTRYFAGNDCAGNVAVIGKARVGLGGSRHCGRCHTR